MAESGMEVAFQLFDLAVDMLRTRLRRERPGITEAELESEVDAWISRRPGAEQGDAEGRPRQS